MKARLFAAALLLSCCYSAGAALVPYEIALRVQKVTHPIGGCAEAPGPVLFAYPCNAQPGDVYRGHFSIPDDVLFATGLVTDAPIFAFYLQIGNVVFDQNRPAFPLGTENPSQIRGLPRL
jgi:hypothetical protein